jgi:hypothetical protein
MPKPDILRPSPGLLCKLGSIIIQGASAEAHPFDVIALRQLLADPEVKQWLDGMAVATFLPVRRS